MTIPNQTITLCDNTKPEYSFTNVKTVRVCGKEYKLLSVIYFNFNKKNVFKPKPSKRVFNSYPSSHGLHDGFLIFVSPAMHTFLSPPAPPLRHFGAQGSKTKVSFVIILQP